MFCAVRRKIPKETKQFNFPFEKMLLSQDILFFSPKLETSLQLKTVFKILSELEIKCAHWNVYRILFKKKTLNTIVLHWLEIFEVF